MPRRKLHGYGTGLSGEYSEVMKAIEACHEAVHAVRSVHLIARALLG